MDNIYQQIGGEKTVNTLVDNFYNKVLVDRRVNHLLNKINLKTQKLRTVLFLTLLMGEKLPYSNKYPENPLDPQNLTEEQLFVFEEIWHHVLIDMDLLDLIPLVSQALFMARSIKRNKTNHKALSYNYSASSKN